MNLYLDNKDKIAFYSTFDEMAKAKKDFEATVDEINKKASTILNKCFIGKFYRRTYGDGVQFLYKVEALYVDIYYNKIQLHGPKIAINPRTGKPQSLINGTEIIFMNETPHIDYKDEEISEEEYNKYYRIIMEKNGEKK